jgi:hypothetical protein
MVRLLSKGMLSVDVRNRTNDLMCPRHKRFFLHLVLELLLIHDHQTNASHCVLQFSTRLSLCKCHYLPTIIINFSKIQKRKRK